MGDAPLAERGRTGSTSSPDKMACCSGEKERPMEAQPLLVKDLPRYTVRSVKEDLLKFDATEVDQARADIVLSFAWDEQTMAGKALDAHTVDPIQLLRVDMFHRIVRAGLTYTTMKSADMDEVFILIGNGISQERLMEAAETQKLECKLKATWKVPYAPFSIDRKNDFVMEDKATNQMFSSRDRQTLIFGVLNNGDFETADEMTVSPHLAHLWKEKYGLIKYPSCGLNIKGYLEEGVLSHCFGMHDENFRNELLSEWASPSAFIRQAVL